MDNTYPYIASITREQFLFYEMRTTAKLLSAGMTENQAIEEIVKENLFQYPTERSVKGMARSCIKRLHSMNDESLIDAIANQPSEVAKQICLYAMMVQSRLVYEFMLTVIGNKYRIKDYSFGRIDVNSFVMRLQEQNDTVASWSDSTITKVKQVLVRLLIENNYLNNLDSKRLNSVWIHPILESAIREKGDITVLPAFGCFS